MSQMCSNPSFDMIMINLTSPTHSKSVIVGFVDYISTFVTIFKKKKKVINPKHIVTTFRQEKYKNFTPAAPG